MKTVVLKSQAEFILKPQEDTLYLVLLSSNGDNSKVKVDLFFRKSRVNCRLLFLGRNLSNGEWQIESNANHFAEHTSCNIDVYLSLANKAKVDFFGKIFIDKKAFHAKSFLQERGLVIGDSVYNRSQPVLEIFNNKVKASHSASCARLNKDDLFYLMSRGFNKQEAESILEKAFFDLVLGSIKDKKAHKIVEDYLC